MPSPFEAVLLGLLAWRIWHLLAEDTILDRPRRYVTDRLGDEAEEFITCPFCAGFHVSLLVYVAWIWLPTATLYVAVLASLNAAVVLVNWWLTKDDPHE